jgi:hypothetical protein
VTGRKKFSDLVVRTLRKRVKGLERELESALKIIGSNQEELARLRHLVAHPDFNLPAALAIVRERDEWRTNYELAQRRVTELEGSCYHKDVDFELPSEATTWREIGKRAFAGLKSLLWL